MSNIKKVYKSIKPRYIKSADGRVLEAFIDIKSYRAVIEELGKWEATQKKHMVKWVQVSREKAQKKGAI